MDIEKKVIECAALVYEVDETEITLETDIREDLSAQSMPESWSRLGIL